MIQVLNLNLCLNHNISTSTYQPFSIAEFNNQIYVGDYFTGTILVIVNEVIINTFNGCNGNAIWLTYILFDNCGLMATSCHNNQLSLYHSNGTYLRKNFTTPSGPHYFGFDSIGRFFQISHSEIIIYN